MSTKPGNPYHRPNRKKVHPSKDEYSSVLEAVKLTAAKWVRDRDFLILVLMGDCGLRISEVLQLRHRQACTHNCIVTALELEASQCKRGYARTVPTTPRVQTAISDYIHSQGYFIESADQYLFPSQQRSGRHLSPRTVQIALNRYSLISIGRKITPHQLRHYAATELLKVTNTRVVQQFLGHQRINTTEIYTHPDFSDMKIAMDKMLK